MTDNEIIKALARCVNADCENCPSKTICDSDTERLVVKVFDLINRQKAEIERLEREIEHLESTQEISPEAKHFVDTKADKVISLMNELIKSQEQIKAEAVKEFAEKLKTNVFEADDINEDTFLAVEVSYIDNLVKEFTEGESHGMA